MKKLAIPIRGNDLNPHFGHSEYFKFYELKDEMVVNETIVKAPVHKPGVLPSWLVDMHVTDVITGGIGHKAIEIFSQNKVNVFVGVEVKETTKLVSDFLNGTLQTNGNQCDH